jgi:hypothetical protein
MEKTVALFKLISGEELIAEYKSDGEFYVLKSPRKVFVQQTSQTTFGVKVAPWLVGAPDGVFPVHAGHILTVCAEPNPELVAGYLKETSPIDLSATAPKSIIAP